ncbi:MAG: MoxR family ATPase [Flavobacteriaceae bacterium]|nr:MoxR family ATPase [Flavobacteriaceae bacterium]
MNLSAEHIQKLLEQQAYVSDSSIATSIYLSMLLKKPLLIEGPAGVGKTEIAKVIADALDTGLIRLQCYEGLDANQAIYEWNYQRQLLYLKMTERMDISVQEKESDIFGEEYLLERPLLKSIRAKTPQVLLIDEIDRADEEFESFFLELLSEWQISIPEIGTIKAESIPYAIITSNRVRELSDALRRRCLYLWIDFPSFDKELEIIIAKVPNINKTLAEQITTFMGSVRQMKLEKLPGVSETLDWATALASMHIDHLSKEVVESTLGIILKDWKDIRDTQLSLDELFEKVGVQQKMK